MKMKNAFYTHTHTHTHTSKNIVLESKANVVSFNFKRWEIKKYLEFVHTFKYKE